MDEATQQNAALMEQTAATSTSMVAQARQLKQLTAFFTLTPDNTATAAAPQADSALPVSSPQPKAARAVTMPPVRAISASTPVSGTNGKHPVSAGPTAPDEQEWHDF
jgi:hypothetical protein